MSVDELQKKIPGFDWKSYIKAISPNHEVKELSAGQMDFMKGMAQLFAKSSLDDIKAYYEWNVISSASAYLSDAFVEANFDFYGRTMSGQTEMKPRWKRSVSSVNGILGEPVGKMYVEKYFPAAAKERILKLVENVRLAMGDPSSRRSWPYCTTKGRHPSTARGEI